MERINIRNDAEISAIYFALLHCGYEFYAVEKDAALVAKLEQFRAAGCDFDTVFFARIRQSMCEPYPFWPRAALLETATFYMREGAEFADFTAYRERVMAAANLQEIERNQDFWTWIDDAPTALQSVTESDAFREYSAWEFAWVAEQRIAHRDELRDVQRIVEHCVNAYASPVRSVEAVLCPIKCAYSADHHFGGIIFTCISARFDREHIVHELLHHVVHPIVSASRDAILRRETHFDDLDASYYLDGSDDGRLNAFEEAMVRRLTERALGGELPPSLAAFANELW